MRREFCVWEAADGETVTGQGLQVMQLFKVAIANVATCFVALPQQGLVAGFCKLLGGIGERRIPAPGIGAG